MIGIITFQRAINYGAVLQAYSLCSNVRRYCDCEIVDYYNRETVWGPKSKTIKTRLLQELRKIVYCRRKRRFIKFWRETDFISAEKYRSRDALRAADRKYDAFIAGSDQIWNQDNTNSDAGYFLEFVTGGAERKLSYAASFGSTKTVERLPDSMINLLDTFGSLSLREPESVNLLRNRLGGKQVLNHIDPVFLTGRDEWGNLASKSPKGSYVLLYLMRKSDRLISYARDVARHMGAKIFMVPVGLKREPGIVYYTNAGPKEFLGLLKGAAHVVTNSFHGVAFSLIFQRQLTVQLHSEENDTNDRFLNLISLFRLENRCITDKFVPDFDSTFDYCRVEGTIEKQAQAAKTYLKSVSKELFKR